jgi:hypothetical protein
MNLKKSGTSEGSLLGWRNRKTQAGGQLKAFVRQSAGIPNRYTGGRKRQLEGQRDAIDKIVGRMSDDQKIKTIQTLMNLTAGRLRKQVEEILGAR